MSLEVSGLKSSQSHQTEGRMFLRNLASTGLRVDFDAIETILFPIICSCPWCKSKLGHS